MRKWLTNRHRKTLYIILPLAFILGLYHVIANTYITTDIGYLTRPLWDKVHEEWDIIPHYVTEDLSLERACQLHGWNLTTGTAPKLIDAVIFSVELDMYEVRLRELWDVVDTFIVLESNATFTGNPKPFVFAENAERFAFAKEKLLYARVYQQALPPNESPFHNEIEMRISMNENIEKVANEGDLLIISDVDEIPRPSTLKILKACSGVPSPLHLQLRNYLYSFEFPVDFESWRARVERYRKGITRYSHGQKSKDMLADAGK
jgi:beta-1,4-mannosyl-glycoprotein beta-1,4-N-acetylglucosaminyltransferase